MADAADVSMTPTMASYGIESNGSNCWRTMASCSRPTRTFAASSRDTNQFSATEKIPSYGCRIVQIHEVNRPTEEVRSLADGGEIDRWW